jgi:phosphoglycolate phosphatase
VGDIRRLIAFDLDGTLIDSSADLASAANALIVERGGARLPDGAVVRMVGDGAAMLVKRALTAAGLPFDAASVERFLALYDERLLETTVAYAGIREALEALAPHGALAVLTNKPIGPTRKVLAGLGLAPFFASVIGGDSPFGRKPDPAALRHLLSEHRADPGASIMIGDSRVDLETGRAAGTAVCLTRYGFGYQGFDGFVPGARERVVGTPAEISAVVQTLLAI